MKHFNINKIIKLYCLALSLFYIQPISSQDIYLKDCQTGRGIPFANIISSDGKLVGLSNINGNINKTKILKSLKERSNKLIIQHLSYDNYNISVESFKDVDTLKMNKRQNLLPEVTAIPENKKVYDYIVITGYYRCYQLEDSITKYYKDGVVEFYIPKKGKNIKRIILNSRSFLNSELIEQQKTRKFMVNINGTVIPNLDQGSILNELGKQYTTKEYQKEKLVLRTDSVVGAVRSDSSRGLINIYVDLIAPQKEEIHNLFNYTSRITNINISENYWSGEISSFSKSDLESKKEYRKLFFKHKKDKSETAIDIISELYIVDKKYVSKEEYSKKKKVPDQSYSSAFSNEYWNDLSKYNIPQLNEPIKLLLENKLAKE